MDYTKEQKAIIQNEIEHYEATNGDEYWDGVATGCIMDLKDCNL